jgi:UDP-N-acetylmuramoyl-tripeptide--D-alanyl-D-alanine ligase
MIYPAMMAAAVAEHFGMSGEEITRGMRAFLPTRMRMNILRLPGDVVVLNDSYNASPQSMRAAAAVLGDARGRRVAVVGDMLELGENSALFHQAVGASFGAYGIHCVIAIGTLARHIADGAREAGVNEVYHFERKEDALPMVLAQLQPGATILVKASRRMAFEELAAALAETGGCGE